MLRGPRAAAAEEGGMVERREEGSWHCGGGGSLEDAATFDIFERERPFRHVTYLKSSSATLVKCER